MSYVEASITIVHIQKFCKMQENIVRLRFFFSEELWLSSCNKRSQYIWLYLIRKLIKYKPSKIFASPPPPPCSQSIHQPGAFIQIHADNFAANISGTGDSQDFGAYSVVALLFLGKFKYFDGNLLP